LILEPTGLCGVIEFGLLDGIIQKTSINSLCIADGAVLTAASQTKLPIAFHGAAHAFRDGRHTLSWVGGGWANDLNDSTSQRQTVVHRLPSSGFCATRGALKSAFGQTTA
jgi:hypothetical protein